jgi:PKD repeat protein
MQAHAAVTAPPMTPAMAPAARVAPTTKAAPAPHWTMKKPPVPKAFISRLGGTRAFAAATAGTSTNPYCSACTPPLLTSPDLPVMGGVTGTPGQVDIVPLYWAPSGYSFSASYESLIDGYLQNVQAASGQPSNVFSVATQYYQASPPDHIRYAVSTGNQIVDGDAYPASGGTAGCTPDTGFTACVTDAAMQSELRAFVNKVGDPISDSVLYLVMLPPGVESCFYPGSAATGDFCSTNAFCGYNGADYNSPYLAYASSPYPDLSACTDPTNGPQAPNGDAFADAEINIVSANAFDSVTDWGTAWLDSANFQSSDECAGVYGAPLGSTGSAGTLYNQVIGSGKYYTQDEFSNEDFALGLGDKTTTNGTFVAGCVQREETISASYTAPASIAETSEVQFDGSTSSDSDGSASTDPAHTTPLSYSWGWGDGTVDGTGATPVHVFCAAGTFTVTLTVTDLDGWTASVSHDITVTTHPPTVISISPSSGPGGGGTAVTVVGCGLGESTAVYFGLTPAEQVFPSGPTEVTAISPAHAAGTFDVIVTNPYGSSPPTPADAFTYPALIQYFSWFDKATPGMLADNIHIMNPGTNTAHVTVSLPGASTISVAVAPSAERYVTFPRGIIGGPVTVGSDWPVVASQRVQYFQSFNEVWAMDPATAATVSYISWFDKATNGMVGDNIHVLNPGSTMANVSISMPTGAPISFALPGGQATYRSFPRGTIGGPVKIESDVPVLAAQRVQYFQSFNEDIARSAAMATADSYFSWFDNLSRGMVADNIHLFNPGTTVASVLIRGAINISATVQPGKETYVRFPGGAIGGPVRVTSIEGIGLGPPVLVWQRVQYYQSFNEVPSREAANAPNTSHIMWFDRVTPGMVSDNIHVVDAGGGVDGVANVTVSMPGARPISFQLTQGQERYVSFAAGKIGGPVTISSTGAGVLASARVEYYRSFNEVPAA